MKILILSLLIFTWGTLAVAQSDSTKTYLTARVSGAPPEIDGKLDDAAWAQVEWGGNDFRQMNPDKGKPATVQTKFKILYDEKNLYVGIRALDPEPSKIVRRMSRRDSFEGDMVEINIDSYYDRRTAFSFTASVSGVKGDEYVSNNGEEWDPGWDPIWYLKTSIDDEGWIAEFRIPLSQLRFADLPELTWGLQVMRIYFRNQERSQWQYIPPDAAGYVHLFGDLKGIKGIRPQKQLEIQPYLVGSAERFQDEPGNPFASGKSSSLDAGLDAKIGITSDITLDLTVNPDFGQVEADPSQVNLTAFELFFQERRPFFIEGNNTLNFPLAMINSNNMFYSRRIGRQPQIGADPDEEGADGVQEYVKSNTRTTILGAAKLTGKNKNGFSWGILESLTSREFATIDSLGHRRKQAIEPMTNYLVGRAQQDINKGNTIIGAMATATNRTLDDERLSMLHKSAYSGGFDVLHHWKSREYYVSLKGVVGHVRGSEEAIANTQLSAERYFQRPDNHHTEFDPTRRSLTGTSGQVILGKKSGDLVSDLGLQWQSPELELNDIGFMAQTDNIVQWFWMQYRILQPRRFTRSQRFNINEFRTYDFGMRNVGEGYNFNAHAELKNFWQIGGGIGYDVRNSSNADLRGGPTIRYPGSLYYWGYAQTDRRKKLNIGFFPEFARGREKYYSSTYLQLDLTYQPTNALNISVSPSVNFTNNKMQYVTTTTEIDELSGGPSGKGTPQYVVAEIDQTVARVSIRLTYMLTPNLSIQYWGQPFGAEGKYKDFKYITDARADEFHQRYVAWPSTSMVNVFSHEYAIDPDGNGMANYRFSNPDFNFGQFRSNMVIRWEYIPGSTVFFVWTQERNGAFYNDGGNAGRYVLDFDQKGHNIFLIKYTYRFVL